MAVSVAPLKPHVMFKEFSPSLKTIGCCDDELVRKLENPLIEDT
jgi:hypothetical protein